MAEAALKAAGPEEELTDGFNLIIDALKLNGAGMNTSHLILILSLAVISRLIFSICPPRS